MKRGKGWREHESRRTYRPPQPPPQGGWQMRPGALGPQEASRDPFPHYWAGYRDEGIMGVLDRAEAGKASKTRWHVRQALGEGTPPRKQQI